MGYFIFNPSIIYPERIDLMKAVVMAGGEGSRLRPLTCNIPKPMARILGRPILGYIFEALDSGGVTQANVTLGYLPHIIEDEFGEKFGNMKLKFIREDEPLGTAGGVKAAAEGFDEPFFVVSGDALCDFDFAKIMDYHKASGAKITIVATKKSDPREFGVVKVGKENRIYGFIEKPSWSQAVSNLANTGVYVVNPECLSLIPKNKKYDFARDLFPLMLERDMPIYCYNTDSYWCDVGNIATYMECQSDIFDGRMKPLCNKIADGIYCPEKLPTGDYSIVPPVYIGRNAEICDGAVIGPYAVVDDNCYIGENAKVRYSAILENACLSRGSAVTGALVCSGAALKKGASMFENSVAGSGSIIGENAAVKPGVLVWPGKIIAKETNVSDNVRYGNIRTGLMNENGFCEDGGARLTPEACVRIGAAVGSTRNGSKCGLATDGSRSAQVLRHAVVSGILGVGGSVWDFGCCFEAQLNFLVNFCGLGSGMFISGKDKKEIRICGEGGLSIPRFFERSIESYINKGEIRETDEKSIKELNEMSSVGLIYKQELLKTAPYGLSGLGARVVCENPIAKNMLVSALKKLGCTDDGEFIIELSPSGTSARIIRNGNETEYEKILAICCLNEMKNGRDISVPYDAPGFLDALAGDCGKRVYRYLSTPADDSDSVARRLAAKQIFVRDGLFLAIKLLSVMKERECGFDDLLSELPESYIIRKTVPIGFSPADLAGLVGEEKISLTNGFEGIRLVRSKGRLLIVPERDGEKVRICAEADSMEAACELCGDIEDLINSINLLDNNIK